MSTYIHFTEEQKTQARQTDIVSLLKSQGETVKRSGSEYEWKDGSQKVTIRGNLWFHQYDRVGGDAIDFVRRFYNKNYAETVEYLLGNDNGTLITSPPVVKEQKPFKLPPRNDNIRRVFAYLNFTRRIDKEVLYTFVHHKMIYESAKYHNAVFVGFDKDGNPRHASMRGIGSKSTYKGNAPNSQPEYSFHWHGSSNRLYLFEAPIDMLSFISMHKDNWETHSYAACCGVADRVLWQMLKDNPNINTVCLCLDNDEAGKHANKRISEKLIQKGIQSENLIPLHKDWNEDRLAAGGNEPHFCADFFIPNEDKRGDEEPCQAFQL